MAEVPESVKVKIQYGFPPINIYLKKLRPNTIIPSYAHDGDSGMDLYYCPDMNDVPESLPSGFRPDGTVMMEPGRYYMVPCGFSIAVPEGYEGQVRTKSGLAWKQGLVVINSPGTIDSGYRGEIQVICGLVPSANYYTYTLKPLTKIAQLVICPVVKAEFVEVEELDITSRNEGGFGSTGI